MPRVHDQYKTHFPEQNGEHFHHNHVENVVKDIVGKKGTNIPQGLLLLQTATSKEVTKTNRDLRNFVTTFIEILGKTYDLKTHSPRFHELKALFESQTKAYDESQATQTARDTDAAAQLRIQQAESNTAREHDAAEAARTAQAAAEAAAAARIAAAEDQANLLRAQIQSAEERLLSLTGKLPAATEAARAAEQATQLIKEKLASTEELLEKATARATKAEAEIVVLQGRLDILMGQIATHKDQATDMQAALDQSKKETAALRNQLEEQAAKMAAEKERAAQDKSAPELVPEVISTVVEDQAAPEMDQDQAQNQAIAQLSADLEEARKRAIAAEAAFANAAPVQVQVPPPAAVQQQVADLTADVVARDATIAAQARKIAELRRIVKEIAGTVESGVTVPKKLRPQQ